MLISITDTHGQLVAKPELFFQCLSYFKCRNWKGKNKHLCSTCTHLSCATSHILRVTWLQLPMPDCYIGLILKTYHHLLIFFFFSLPLCKGEERGRDPVSNKPQPVQLHMLPNLLASEISLNTSSVP